MRRVNSSAKTLSWLADGTKMALLLLRTWKAGDGP